MFKLSQLLLKLAWNNIQKQNIYTVYDPSISQNVYTGSRIFISLNINIWLDLVKIWTSQTLIDNWMDEKIVIYLYSEILYNYNEHMNAT